MPNDFLDPFKWSTAELEFKDPFTWTDPDPWEDRGIFERNTDTGEIRLKAIPGALGGLSEDYYKQHEEITKDKDSILSDLDLTNWGKEDSSNPAYNLALGAGVGLSRMGTDIYHGGSSVYWDMIGAGWDAIGAEDLADQAESYARYHKEVKQEYQDAYQELRPTVNPKDDGILDQFITGENDPWKKFNDFAFFFGENAAPMFAASGLGSVASLATRGAFTAAEAGGFITQALYGADTFQDSYLETREQGLSVIPAAAAAGSAAIISGKLERYGFENIMRPGQGIIRSTIEGALKEGITEGTQQLATGTINEVMPVAMNEGIKGLVDPNQIQWGDFFKEVRENTLGGAFIGGPIKGGITGINRLLAAEQKKPLADVRFDELSEKQKESLNKDLAVLKTTMYGRGLGQLGYSDIHRPYVEAFLTKWGHVTDFKNGLEEAIRQEADAFMRSKSSTLKSLSETQVQAETLGNMEFTENPAPTEKPPIDVDHEEDIPDFWEILQRDVPQQQAPNDWRTVQKDFQSRLNAAETIMDTFGVLDAETVRSIDLGFLAFIGDGRSGLLTPAQRERAINLYERMARVATDKKDISTVFSTLELLQSDADLLPQATADQLAPLFQQLDQVRSIDTDITVKSQAVNAAIASIKDQFGGNITSQAEDLLADLQADLISQADEIRASSSEADPIVRKLNALAANVGSLLPSRKQATPSTTQEEEFQAMDSYATDIHTVAKSVGDDVDLLRSLFNSMVTTRVNMGSTPETGVGLSTREVQTMSRQLMDDVNVQELMKQILTKGEQDILTAAANGMPIQNAETAIDWAAVEERVLTARVGAIDNKWRKAAQQASAQGRDSLFFKVMGGKPHQDSAIKSARVSAQASSDLMSQIWEKRKEVDELRKLLRKAKRIGVTYGDDQQAALIDLYQDSYDTASESLAHHEREVSNLTRARKLVEEAEAALWDTAFDTDKSGDIDLAVKDSDRKLAVDTLIYSLKREVFAHASSRDLNDPNERTAVVKSIADVLTRAGVTKKRALRSDRARAYQALIQSGHVLPFNTFLEYEKAVKTQAFPPIPLIEHFVPAGVAEDIYGFLVAHEEAAGDESQIQPPTDAERIALARAKMFLRKYANAMVHGLPREDTTSWGQQRLWGAVTNKLDKDSGKHANAVRSGILLERTYKKLSFLRAIIRQGEQAIKEAKGLKMGGSKVNPGWIQKLETELANLRQEEKNVRQFLGNLSPKGRFYGPAGTAYSSASYGLKISEFWKVLPELRQDLEQGLVTPSTELKGDPLHKTVQDKYTEFSEEEDPSKREVVEAVQTDMASSTGVDLGRPNRVRQITDLEVMRLMAPDIYAQAHERADVLINFYQVAKGLGYTFRAGAVTEAALSEPLLTPAKEQALSYLERFYDAAVEAVGVVGTPANIANMMLEAGSRPESIRLGVALVARLVDRATVQSGMSRIDAVRMIVPHVLAVEENPDVAAGEKAEGPYGEMRGGANPVILLNTEPVTGFDRYHKGSTLIHEVLHGLLESGAIRKLLPPEQIARLELFLGEQIPEFGAIQKKKKISVRGHELFASGLERVASLHESEDPVLNRAFIALREDAVDAFTSLTKDGVFSNTSGVATFGFPMINGTAEVYATLFSGDKAPMHILPRLAVPRQFSTVVGDSVDGIIIHPGSRIANEIQSISGLNISWAMFDDIFKALDDASLIAAGAVERIAQMKRTAPKSTPGLTYNDFVENVLGLDPKNINDEYSKVLRDAHKLSLDFRTDKKRIGNRASMIQQIDLTTHRASEGGEIALMLRAMRDLTYPLPFGDTGTAQTPSSRPTALREQIAHSRLDKEVADATAPLAGVQLDTVEKVIDHYLRLSASPFTNPEDISGKSAVQTAFHKLWAVVKNPGKYFDSRTIDLERILRSHGFTSEYFRLYNQAGVLAQARENVEHDVIVYQNGKWVSIGEGLQPRIDRIPPEMREDTFRYLAARRTLELVARNKRLMDKYETDLLKWEAGEYEGKFRPDRPKTVELSADTIAAAVVAKYYLEARYGKEGGEVGKFAKSIVDWGHTAIVDKLRHYGMLSDKEVSDLKANGEWWIPLVSAMDHESFPTESIPNEGARGALANLRGFSGEIIHPLEEMIDRAQKIHILVSNQAIRNAALAAITVDPRTGQAYSAEHLKAIGVERLTERVHRQITPQEWQQLPPSERAQYTVKGTTKYYSVLDEPIDRMSFSWWAKQNSGKLPHVYSRWMNGRVEYYTITNSEIKEAIDSIPPKQLGPMMKLLSATTRFVGSMITHGPMFILNMPFKDFPNAINRSKSGMNVLTIVPDFIRGLGAALPEIFPTLMQEFPEHFGLYANRRKGLASQTSFMSTFNEAVSSIYFQKEGYELLPDRNGVKPPKTLRAMRAVWHDIVAGGTKAAEETVAIKTLKRLPSVLRTPLQHVTAGAKMAWAGLGALSSWTDAALRMREREMVKRGLFSELDRFRDTQNRLRKDQEAIDAMAKIGDAIPDDYIDALDRQITLDFSRKGDVVQKIAAAKMFAGPMFQDTTTTLQRLFSPNGAERAAFILRALSSYTMPAIVNYLRWYDDDDWRKLSAWDKYSYFHLWKNDDTSFKKVPNGLGVMSVLFKDIPIGIMEMVSNRDQYAMEKLKNQIVEQTPLIFVPVVQDAKEWLVNVMPTILEPVAEVGVNWNTFANAPVDPYDKFTSAPRPEDRGLAKYGVIEKFLANAMGTSPLKVGHVLRSTFPGVGQIAYGGVNEVLTSVYRHITGDNEVGSEYKATPKEIVLKLDTGRTWGPASQPVNDLYFAYDRAAKAHKSMTKAYESGYTAKGDAIWKGSPELAYYDLLKSGYGMITQLKIKKAQYLKASNEPDSVKELTSTEVFDRQMTMLADEILAEMRRASSRTPAQGIKK